jgi:hypothetical protein
MMTAKEVRQAALALPETKEQETWGEATFRVKDKIFVTLAADGKSAGVKSDKTNQALLVKADPETFSISHYVGRFGWVTVRLDRVRKAVMRDMIVDSWRRTAPKRTVAAFDVKQKD